MGLFSGFNPVKAITRAVGIPDKYSKPLQYTFAPFTVPTSLALQAGGKILASATSQSHGVAGIHDQGYQPPYYGNVPQPAGPQYIYAGGGGAYSPFQGGPTGWDYSTPLTTYSPQPWVTYQPSFQAQPSQGDRIWEDLTLASSLFL